MELTPDRTSNEIAYLRQLCCGCLLAKLFVLLTDLLLLLGELLVKLALFQYLDTVAANTARLVSPTAHHVAPAVNELDIVALPHQGY